MKQNFLFNQLLPSNLSFYHCSIRQLDCQPTLVIVTLSLSQGFQNMIESQCTCFHPQLKGMLLWTVIIMDKNHWVRKQNHKLIQPRDLRVCQGEGTLCDQPKSIISYVISAFSNGKFRVDALVLTNSTSHSLCEGLIAAESIQFPLRQSGVGRMRRWPRMMTCPPPQGTQGSSCASKIKVILPPSDAAFTQVLVLVVCEKTSQSWRLSSLECFLKAFIPETFL